MRLGLLPHRERRDRMTTALAVVRDGTGDRVSAHGETADRVDGAANALEYEPADQRHRLGKHRRAPAIEVEGARLSGRKYERLARPVEKGVRDEEFGK